MMFCTVGNQRSCSWRRAHRHTQTHTLALRDLSLYEHRRREGGCTITRPIGQNGVFIPLLDQWQLLSCVCVYMCVFAIAYSHLCVPLPLCSMIVCMFAAPAKWSHDNSFQIYCVNNQRCTVESKVRANFLWNVAPLRNKKLLNCWLESYQEVMVILFLTVMLLAVKGTASLYWAVRAAVWN